MASLTKPVSLVLLTCWTLTALFFTALDALNASSSWTQLIASSTLLTFLACRLLVTSTSDTTSLAHDLTTAYKHSRPAALTLLVLAVSWLWELIFKCIGLLFMTFFGALVTAAIYNTEFEDELSTSMSDSTSSSSSSASPSYTAKPINNKGNMIELELMEDTLSQVQASSNNLVPLEDFEENTGVDPEDVIALFKMIPPRLLIYVAGVLWVNLGSLVVYVLVVAWRGVKGVFGSQGINQGQVVHQTVSQTNGNGQSQVQIQGQTVYGLDQGEKTGQAAQAAPLDAHA
ncbi:hypothetical protein BDV18DRAFT_161351 [Aspergillus unguis]